MCNKQRLYLAVQLGEKQLRSSPRDIQYTNPTFIRDEKI